MCIRDSNNNRWFVCNLICTSTVVQPVECCVISHTINCCVPRWHFINYNDDIVFIQYLHTVLTTNDDNNTTTIIVVNINQLPYGEYNNNAGNCGHLNWSWYPHHISIRVLWYKHTYYICIEAGPSRTCMLHFTLKHVDCATTVPI